MPELKSAPVSSADHATKKEMKILVCGGRDFVDRQAAFTALDHLAAQRNVVLVIEGGARGADTLARQWAEERGIPVKTFPADWQAHGKEAGHIRNQHMLEEGKPDAVVAFPGGKGTADMIRRAQAAGLKVWRPYPAIR